MCRARSLGSSALSLETIHRSSIKGVQRYLRDPQDSLRTDSIAWSSSTCSDSSRRGCLLRCRDLKVESPMWRWWGLWLALHVVVKMLDIFRGLKSLIKISHIHIDTAVFRLHYSLTVILLVAFSLIVTTRQYVGNPIDCIHSKDLPEDVLNTYCWIHSTYTITAAYKKKEGLEVPFPGIANSKDYPVNQRKEYRYYQWVCFMLFLQVIIITEDFNLLCFCKRTCAKL